MASSTSYAPLWVKTNHSFLQGASSPHELVEQAHALGLHSLAITDRDGVYGLARAHVHAKKLGVRLTVGSQLTLGESKQPLVVLAKTRRGYAWLCQALSRAHSRCEKGEAQIEIEDLRDAHDVFVLCDRASLVETLSPVCRESLVALFTRHLHEGENQRHKALFKIARQFEVPMVGATEVLYHDRSRRALHDVLSCIRAGCTLHQAGQTIRSNKEHDLKSDQQMMQLFSDAPELLRGSLDIAEQCEFSLDQIQYRYPEERLPTGQSEHSWLRELTMRGARRRYGGKTPADVRVQIERELRVIGQLGYGGYFLTMCEVVDYCKANGILCQGRGSAANSAVCFCLGITAIDPVRMDLLFERFLSVERAEPPDIDLDIEHGRREEVIQHMYEKYGRRHAAMVANVVRYRIRSAVRDVGKVLGIAQTDLDATTRMLRHRDDALNPALLRDAGLQVEAPVTRQLWSLATEILDFPRHLSIHPGGFLLGDRPVDELVPIEPATMEDRTVIQWDKYDVDDLGLFKVDLLGLGALTCAHTAFDLLKEHKELSIEMATVPASDVATFDMISAGDTVGVFQIESRAQMAMLPRLKPRTFYDLVIEVAIVRPGPIQGDMVHPYLRRRSGQEPIEYPHPKLEKILKKTLGVPIFQEQVMKLAVEAAGYTPGQADQLRRDMAAWRRSGRIEKHRDKMIPQMIAQGIPEAFAERVFSQIRGFGEYGFPESHAASFALLAYVTAWLKCHHPEVFACAILNAQPMGFYSPATLVEDAKRHGVSIRPIDVNQSEWDCSLEKTESGAHAVRMGLRYVKGLSTAERETLENAPRPYLDLATFAKQTKLRKNALVALAKAGAFESLGINRRDALWQARVFSCFAKDSLSLTAADSQISFASLSEEDKVWWDFTSSHHSARGHPMRRLRETLRVQSIPDACTVRVRKDGCKLDYVGMVICRQRPATASGVTFFTLEDETGFVNVVVWRDVFRRHATIAKTATLLGVSGHIQYADNVTHLIAERLWLPKLNAPATRSRDFH